MPVANRTIADLISYLTKKYEGREQMKVFPTRSAEHGIELNEKFVILSTALNEFWYPEGNVKVAFEREVEAPPMG